jgi:hypothetical protein
VSKSAGYIVRAIIVAALALEVAACAVYEDSTDGQTVLVNVAILFCAAFAIGAVEAIDYEVRRRRGRTSRGVRLLRKWRSRLSR